jgi:hypothetical protein
MPTHDSTAHCAIDQHNQAITKKNAIITDKRVRNQTP